MTPAAASASDSQPL
uniref:Uncharacterized protein n=1 Tax=Arundo donax TaxID=35708 RepID=A0A0A9B3K2_ARUDO